MNVRLLPARLLVMTLPLAAMSAVVPSGVRAQPVEESIARGVALYRGLAFVEAAAALRRALATPEAARLPDSARAVALTYVGAAEVHLGRVPRGEVAFRDALARSPQYRIDTLEFPPAVSSAFEEARRRTAFVVARTARDTTLLVGSGRVEFRLAASAPHSIQVTICEASGVAARRLYQGVIGDTLVVDWDGLDAQRAEPLAGELALCVESIGFDAVTRRLRLPLRVSVVRPVAERAAPAAATRSSMRGLGIAFGSAAVVAVLPHLVTRSGPPSDRRFVVSGAIIAAALAGRWHARRSESAVDEQASAPYSSSRQAIRLRVEALRTVAKSEEP